MNFLNSLGEAAEAIGELTGIRSRNWQEVRRQHMESEREKMLGIMATLFSITERNEGSEEALLQVKTFLHEEAEKEHIQGNGSPRPQMAAAIMQLISENPDVLRQYIGR